MDAQLLRQIEKWRTALTQDLASRDNRRSAAECDAAAWRLLFKALAVQIAAAQGAEAATRLLASAVPSDSSRSALVAADEFPTLPLSGLNAVQAPTAGIPSLAAEDLGAIYERAWSTPRGQEGCDAPSNARRSWRRKAQGVFYTPPHVVEYILRHTLGPRIASRSPAELAATEDPLCVLDPACGSGAFLLGAYRHLLKHCLKWYVHHQPQRHPQAVYRHNQNAAWQLTLRERLRILRTHLFGVDRDPLAVEVTRLSLLLKALEETTQPTPRAARCGETTLADLAENIRCGDALLEPGDVPDANAAAACEDGRTEPIDWQNVFPSAQSAGGFDVIVGNPPFVNARLLLQEYGPSGKASFARRYATARGAYDLYVLFVEKSLQLLREEGRGGLILPNKIASSDYAKACRRLLLSAATIERIGDVSQFRALPAAGVYPYIVIWRKSPPSSRHAIRIVTARDENGLPREEGVDHIRQQELSAEGGFTIHGQLGVESRVPTQPLGSRAVLHSGTTGFLAERVARGLREREAGDTRSDLEFIVSGNIDRYAITLGNVRFMGRRFARPLLSPLRGRLSGGKLALFRGEKIVLAGITRRIEAAWDRQGLALGVSVYAAAELRDDPRYVLALLNSKLMSYLFSIRFRAKHLAGGFLAINKGQVSQLPIRVIEARDRRGRAAQQRVVHLVERMLSLQCQLGSASRKEQERLERLIAVTDARIDETVYALYGLTDDEIRRVEIHHQRPLASTS